MKFAPHSSRRAIVPSANATVERGQGRGTPFVSFAAWTGNDVFAQCAGAFTFAAQASPPAQVSGFAFGFDHGVVRADATFTFEDEREAAAVEGSLARFFTAPRERTTQPRFDAGERFDLSFAGDTSAPAFAAAFALFAALGVVPFGGTGSRRATGEFFSFFALYVPAFEFNPIPALCGDLSALGFTAVMAGAFTASAAQRFVHDPAE